MIVWIFLFFAMLQFHWQIRDVRRVLSHRALCYLFLLFFFFFLYLLCRPHSQSKVLWCIVLMMMMQHSPWKTCQGSISSRPVCSMALSSAPSGSCSLQALRRSWCILRKYYFKKKAKEHTCLENPIFSRAPYFQEVREESSEKLPLELNGRLFHFFECRKLYK